MNESKTSSELNHMNQIDSVDVREIINTLWKEKLLVILLPVFLTLAIFLLSFFLPTYYKSTAILMAVDEKNADITSEFSNIASLAGFNVESSNKIDEMVEIIKSRKFFEHLITFDDILPSLVASKSYDHQTKKLVFDENVYNSQSKEWTYKSGADLTYEPSYEETHKDFLEDFLEIEEDIRTGFVTISIEHISPVFSKEFLSLIIFEANNIKREQDLETSTRALNYLKSQYSSTSLVEIKESISTLIGVEIKKQMIANISENYVLRPIDPPYLPEEKSWPKRIIIVVSTFLLSILLAVVYVLTRNYLKEIND